MSLMAAPELETGLPGGDDDARHVHALARPVSLDQALVEEESGGPAAVEHPLLREERPEPDRVAARREGSAVVHDAVHDRGGLERQAGVVADWGRGRGPAPGGAGRGVHAIAGVGRRVQERRGARRAVPYGVGSAGGPGVLQIAEAAP